MEQLNVLLALSVILLLFFWRNRNRIHFSQLFRSDRLNENELRILRQYFEFYNRLPSRSKKIFERKVARFIRLKEFIPRRMDSVTTEMKVLISSSAVQLTFGLPQVYLHHFRYILVYPDSYYSNITKKYHKGEVNPRQHSIVLSWKAFLEGYIHREGINLGLHEMAHALHLENRIRNKEYDFLPFEALEKWDELTRKEIKLIKSGNSFFRLYGSTDTYEFFAVAVEYFFERPAELNQQRPQLYQLLSLILNQNPLLLYK